jgi:hypothetical protein
MAQLIDRARREPIRAIDARSSARPVLLATLSVRVDPTAERMALESALEARTSLIVANLVPLNAYPLTFMLAREHMTLPEEEDLDAVRATAERAAKLGIKTELLRISSLHPVLALLELARERRAGLLVFGPDLKRTPRMRFRLAARRVRTQTPCLVWIAPDG